MGKIIGGVAVLLVRLRMGRGPWCGARATQAFTFEWVPKDKAKPPVGSVRIRNASGKVVQVLAGLENARESSDAVGTAGVSTTTAAGT